MAYHDGYQCATVHTHNGFIVLLTKLQLLVNGDYQVPAIFCSALIFEIIQSWLKSPKGKMTRGPLDGRIAALYSDPPVPFNAIRKSPSQLLAIFLLGRSVIFYTLATSKVIPGRIPPWDSVHSCWLYSAAPLGEQATSSPLWCITKSRYLDKELTILTDRCPILLRQTAKLGSDTY